MKQMFKAMPNSPITRITTTVTADATTIPVLEGSKLPTGPNIAVLGIGADSETIIYESNSNGTLRGVTRGVEGTKREWPKGTEIARFYTAYDHNTFIENILAVKGIVESGSNQYGNYKKYADGTMECWGTVSISGSGWTEFGTNKCWSGSKIFKYPQSFVGNAHIVATANDLSVRDRSAFVTICNHVTDGTFKVGLSAWGTTTVDVEVHFTAKGRWK